MGLALLIAMLGSASGALATEVCVPEPIGVGIGGKVDLGELAAGMMDDEKLKLSAECIEGSTPATAPACVEAMNRELEQRYRHIAPQIKQGYARFGSIQLPHGIDCGDGRRMKGLTEQPFSLAYHIASFKQEEQIKQMQALARLLKADSRKDVLSESIPRMAMGRGSPTDYQRAVERLACLYPEKFGTPVEAHEFLVKNGVGLDCAGSVQVMLKELTGVGDNRELGLKPRMDENLGGLKTQPAATHFFYSSDPLRLRPGDVVPLDSVDPREVGHVVIVEKTSFAIAREETRLGSAGDALMRVRVVSSWGHVGPAIQTWVYDLATRQWATEAGDGSYQVTPAGPYGHIYRGQYRAKQLTP